MEDQNEKNAKTAFFYPHEYREERKQQERKIRKKVTLRRIRTLGVHRPPAYSAAAAGHSIEEKGKENKNNKAHNTHLFSRNTHTPTHNTVLHTVLCTTNTKLFLSSYRFLFFRPKKKKSTFPKVFPLLPPFCHISAVPCFPSLC